MTGAKFEYESLIGQGSNERSLMLVTSHVRSVLCSLMTEGIESFFSAFEIIEADRFYYSLESRPKVLISSQ